MQIVSAILSQGVRFNPKAPVELLRAGEFPVPLKVLLVDRPAIDGLVANLKAIKEQPNFLGLQVESDSPGEVSGRLNDLQREGESLLAEIAWSVSGEQSMRSGQFRFFKLGFDPDSIEDCGGGRISPRKLRSVRLTNARELS